MLLTHCAPTEGMFQLMLFRRLPIPRDAVPWVRRRFSRMLRPGAASSIVSQLAFAFRLRELESDRDTEFDYPRRSVVDASNASALASTAPRTVFDLPARPLMGSVGFGGTGVFAPIESRLVAKVEVADGVTRTVGAAYPVRWTKEDEERERTRRARQRPPKPTKRAKTRGRKLLDLIGVDDGD